MKKKTKGTDVLEPLLNDIDINISISAEHAQSSADYLQKLLANEEVLYTKTRNYHWNIECSNFMEMHKFYESLYTDLAEIIDEVAERIRKIGHYAQGRMQDFLEQADLLEGEYTNDRDEQLTNLLEDHETLIRSIREGIGLADEKWADIGTSDYLTGLLREHEKFAWFIRSYLKK